MEDALRHSRRKDTRGCRVVHGRWADSPQAHERLARKVRAWGGHWLLVIKLNRSTVHANLTGLPWDLVTTAEKAHHQIEVGSSKALP